MNAHVPMYVRVCEYIYGNTRYSQKKLMRKIYTHNYTHSYGFIVVTTCMYMHIRIYMYENYHMHEY